MLTQPRLGVKLARAIAPDLPAVKGDPAKLRQVFTNLIANAIKFTPPAARDRRGPRTGTSGGVIAHVRDTGLGMTEEEIAVALTPFAQVDASRSRWREGAGLGLPIAKALVQLHGGGSKSAAPKAYGHRGGRIAAFRRADSVERCRARPEMASDRGLSA